MKTLITSLRILLFFTILTGFIYPLFVSGIAQLVFKQKANGSLIIKDKRIIGSELIGQQFDSCIYFSSRPSAISYNPLPSGGSNLGPVSDKLMSNVHERKLQFNLLNGHDSLKFLPSEMVFASASGLDPHISKAAAILQVDRIARSRSLDSKQKMNLLNTINELTEAPQFGFLGMERINVLALNLALDTPENR